MKFDPLCFEISLVWNKQSATQLINMSRSNLATGFYREFSKIQSNPFVVFSFAYFNKFFENAFGVGVWYMYSTLALTLTLLQIRGKNHTS